VTAHPLRAAQGTDFGIAAKSNMQRLQWQQNGAEVRTGFFRTLGDECDTAMVSRQHLKNQAGLAPVVTVQHISGFVNNTFTHQFPAEPPQGELAPSGGSEAHEVASVGALFITKRAHPCFVISPARTNFHP
jgi:hypothetical protein